MKAAKPGMLQTPRRCCHTLVLAVLLGLMAWPVQPAAQTMEDGRFRQAYQRRYEALRGVASDLVAMELRDRVELIASRGSQVGSASDYRRVRGFESALLHGLQEVICRERPQPAQAPPLQVIIDRIKAAATAQRLRMELADEAELAALVQRLLEGQPREHWCALTSLDDIR